MRKAVGLVAARSPPSELTAAQPSGRRLARHALSEEETVGPRFSPPPNLAWGRAELRRLGQLPQLILEGLPRLARLSHVNGVTVEGRDRWRTDRRPGRRGRGFSGRSGRAPRGSDLTAPESRVSWSLVSCRGDAHTAGIMAACGRIRIARLSGRDTMVQVASVRRPQVVAFGLAHAVRSRPARRAMMSGCHRPHPGRGRPGRRRAGADGPRRADVRPPVAPELDTLWRDLGAERGRGPSMRRCRGPTPGATSRRPDRQAGAKPVDDGRAVSLPSGYARAGSPVSAIGTRRADTGPIRRVRVGRASAPGSTAAFASSKPPARFSSDSSSSACYSSCACSMPSRPRPSWPGR